jgi:hypothetical protein
MATGFSEDDDARDDVAAARAAGFSSLAPLAPPRAAAPQRARARRPARPQQHHGRPTVLVLTDLGSEQFDQFASSVRRHGVRVVRVHTGSPEGETGPGRARTRWLRDRWLYDGCVLLSDAADGTSRARAGADIVDVLWFEATAETAGIADPRFQRITQWSLACSEVPPSLLLDKFALNAHLERHGVRIPAQICAAEIGAAEAVARLGLPLIVKDRIGAAGARVRLADSVEQVDAAVRELGGARGEGAFYQQYIVGDMVMYGAVFDEDGPLIEHGLKVVRSRWPLGPSASLRLFEDSALLRDGRAVMRALGCRGLAEIGFIRDHEGRCWHIDANFRCWGNMVSLLSAGVDYAGAYAALVTGAGYAGARRLADPGAQVDVLPYALYDALSFGSLRDIVREARRFAAMCRDGPGPRYATVITLRATELLVGRGLRTLASFVKRGTAPGPRPTTLKP